MKILDIGANNGNYAKNLCKLGNGNNSVVSIEANPHHKPNLKGYDIIWVNKAVSSVENESIDLYLSKNDVLNTLNPNWLERGRFKNHGNNQKISVLSTTIDSLFVEYGNFDHIKMDVEGYENIAILGMSKNYCPIQFEWASEWFEEITLETLNHLIKLGYCKFNLAYGNPFFDFDPTNLPDYHLPLEELILEVKKIKEKNSDSWGMILAR